MTKKKNPFLVFVTSLKLEQSNKAKVKSKTAPVLSIKTFVLPTVAHYKREDEKNRNVK